MYDFDSLVEEVLKNKPELSRNSLMEQIEEKKNKVGSSYLTDQGALFLIAGELGVRLERITSTDLGLKDLYVGANDITVVARVFAIYPISEYERKDGSGRGRYRRIGLFDSGNVARVTLWDDKVEDVEQAGVTLESPVRVVSGYVKQGFDGKPNLNVGRRGRIVKIEDAELSNKLDSREMARFLDVDDARRVHQLELVGDAAGRATWVKPGDAIRVTRDEDLKEKLVCRRSGSFGISRGDAMPELVSLGVKIDALKSCTWPVLVESIALSRGAVQEVHLKDGSVAKKGEIVIGDDTAEVKLIAWREQAGKLMSIEPGERVRVVGAKPQISQMGILTLQMSGFTRIERLRGR